MPRRCGGGASPSLWYVVGWGGVLSNLPSSHTQYHKKVPVQRTNWLRFASGIVTPAFWSQTMTPQNPSFGWYLDKVVSTVEEAVATHDGEKALLIGHSAGGWLARAALGNGTWTGAAASQANELVRGCVTLGSPHLPPQPPGVDVTRGALQHVHVQYPGAFLRDQGIQYVTVAGVAVQGDGTAERRSLSNFAYRSYIQVCGRGDVVGDGVVPLGSAHLDGAKQVNLKNVFHSINAPDQWYGSEGVIDSWLRQVEGLKY